MILVRYKHGSSIFSVLLAIVLFSGIILSISRWQQAQNRQSAVIFQRQQALLIAHNQGVRTQLGLGCLGKQQRNGITFQIRCTQGKIEVVYPLGQVALTAN
ncbi:DUF5374 domain-containing protein [Spirabiliibacterium falconis]|uniref:DUF5374 domain-containing protein n=1 Tax=Spirabiliibacterium falconis TaxID=572023 RepID=UPI001AACFBAC|nr:DUF5374 domain-containing protein [Spirabiliibacterium falconis]MBE2893843.1 DUF5374 domain-containing protein [Spirabiliibacterium falconis]